MNKKTAIEIAFNILESHNEPITFYELWKQVVEVKEFSEEEAAANVSKFFTALTLDGRFVNLGGNIIQLRTRVTSDKLEERLAFIVQEEIAEETEIDPEEDDEEVLLQESSEESSEERTKAHFTEEE